MDQVVDSEACIECGHDHLPDGDPTDVYAPRQDACCEPGCDCGSYEEPPPGTTKVYKCSSCHRMVTRVWSPLVGSGYTCGECRAD